MIANSANESLFIIQIMDSIAGKKLGTRNNAFSSKLKHNFPLSWMKDCFKNICVNGRKWFSLARKPFSTPKNKFFP